MSGPTPMLVLRPGAAPDTSKASEAGETWRYLADIDGTGDSLLSRRTAAYFYRYQGHPEIDDGWYADCLLCGLILAPTLTRWDIEQAIERHLATEHNAGIANDPGRPR